MFRATPSIGIETGYISSSRAPFQYSGSRGPGTLEITTLNGGRTRSGPSSVVTGIGLIEAAA